MGRKLLCRVHGTSENRADSDFFLLDFNALLFNKNVYLKLSAHIPFLLLFSHEEKGFSSCLNVIPLDLLPNILKRRRLFLSYHHQQQ
jgi:hypothetical protein